MKNQVDLMEALIESVSNIDTDSSSQSSSGGAPYSYVNSRAEELYSYVNSQVVSQCNSYTDNQLSYKLNNAVQLVSSWSSEGGKMGYLEYNNKLVVQYGYVDHWGSVQTISLPSPYKDTGYSISLTAMGTDGDESCSDVCVVYNTQTTTGFNVRFSNANTKGIYWKTIGFKS